MLRRFDVVLVTFPFVDADRVKARPAIVLAVGERHGDVLVMNWICSWQKLDSSRPA